VLSSGLALIPINLIIKMHKSNLTKDEIRLQLYSNIYVCVLSDRKRGLSQHLILKRNREPQAMNLKNRIPGWIFDAPDIQYIVHFKIKFD
jgi:hypothetical protein